MLDHSSDLVELSVMLPPAELPSSDVRLRNDERALRGWTEVSRRVARIVVLVTIDAIAGLAGVFTALKWWHLVSNQGLRPMPWPTPLVAMVLCIQPLALYVTGAYGGGRARRSLERIAGGIA